MTDARDMPPSPGAGDEPEAVLRAKYLDYCSAQVAEALLFLTPDEMYVLAQEAARESGRSEEALSYGEIVTLATRRVQHRIDLPDYESWREEYRRDPARFDREMLGFWRTEVEPCPEG